MLDGNGNRFLLIETSGRVGQVALARAGTVLRSRRLDEARRHARDLAPAVAELLSAERWGPREVDAVFVSKGPGSYTGLRVGIMSAKTFAFATGCRLLALDTFTVLAGQVPPPIELVDVVADAQQGRVYVQSFRRGEPWLPTSPLAIRTLAQWLAERNPGAWATGPGLRICGDQLPEAISQVREGHWDPAIQSMLSLGLSRHLAGQFDDLHEVEPLYLRPSSAEERLPA